MKEMPVHAPLYHILIPVVSKQVKERSVVVSTKAGKLRAVIAGIRKHNIRVGIRWVGSNISFAAIYITV
jgi:hypothetical protein